MLIRFSKRLAIWEAGRTPEEIQRSEFRQKDGSVDLRPSVYEIEREEVERAFAEHATAFDPPRNSAGIDLAGLGTGMKTTRGRTGFAFTTVAHRELSLTSKEDLFKLIGNALAELTTRLHHLSRAQIVSYARARLAAMDPEWQQVVTRAKPGTWVGKLASASDKSGQ